MEELDERRAEVQTLIVKLEASQTTQANLIPQTEELLASYDDMTNEERNELLKEILEKIEYYKGADGQIVIDLYPRLPKIYWFVGILNLHTYPIITMPMRQHWKLWPISRTVCRRSRTGM